MDFFQTISFIISNALNFQGRAPRRQMLYWMVFSLVVFLPAMSLFVLTPRPWDQLDPASFNMDLILACLIKAFWVCASLSLVIRRLHDTDKSGVWIVPFLIPLISFFMMLYLVLANGTPGKNMYGKPFKE